MLLGFGVEIFDRYWTCRGIRVERLAGDRSAGLQLSSDQSLQIDSDSSFAVCRDFTIFSSDFSMS